jgi:hypothetical protein
MNKLQILMTTTLYSTSEFFWSSVLTLKTNKPFRRKAHEIFQENVNRLYPLSTTFFGDKQTPHDESLLSVLEPYKRKTFDEKLSLANQKFFVNKMNIQKFLLFLLASAVFVDAQSN